MRARRAIREWHDRSIAAANAAADRAEVAYNAELVARSEAQRARDLEAVEFHMEIPFEPAHDSWTVCHDRREDAFEAVMRSRGFVRRQHPWHKPYTVWWEFAPTEVPIEKEPTP